jgi:hypothetical protein
MVAMPPPFRSTSISRDPAGSLCLRLPLPGPGTGWLSMIRKLSMRLEPRP